MLCGKEAFSESKWQYEYAHFVKAFVQPDEKLPNCLSQSKKLQAIAKTFMERILVGPKEVTVYEAMLGLCLLALNNLREVGNAGGNLEADLTRYILDKHPMDSFLQAAVNHLLNQCESLIPLQFEGKLFAYPPFQKAIPYFPNYGCQVTLVLKDGNLNDGVVKAIVNIIQKLKGENKLL